MVGGGRSRRESRVQGVLGDPGWLKPAARAGALSIHSPGTVQSARDVLSRSAVKFEGATATVRVPAGAFRLLDLKLSRRSPATRR